MALKRSQYWSISQLDDLRRRRLQGLLCEAASLSFWAQRFESASLDPQDASFSDLGRLSLTSRKDFARSFEEEYVSQNLKTTSFPDQTSGSTGSPFRFYLDRGAVLRSYGVRNRMFETATGGARYDIFTIRARERIGLAFYRIHFFYLRGTYALSHRLPQLAQRVNQKFPDGVVLYAIASWILALAREVEKTGITFPVRAIVSAGEGMRPAERDYVERTLHTHLFLAYGSQESSCMAFECEHKRLHINEEEIYIEILDSAQRPVPTGVTGRIVVTQFDNRVMPFIRYANGDVGSISEDPCPCGRTLRTLQLVGREKDYIKLPEGREITLMDLVPTFDRFFDSVRQYQIVQQSLTNFLIRVVTTDHFPKYKYLLESQLVRILHPSVSITWEIVEDILHAESGKAIYFVKEYTA